LKVPWIDPKKIASQFLREMKPEIKSFFVSYPIRSEMPKTGKLAFLTDSFGSKYNKNIDRFREFHLQAARGITPLPIPKMPSIESPKDFPGKRQKRGL